MSALGKSVTVAAYAKSRGISQDKVLAFIAGGELRAVNLAQSSAGQRPRWRIPLDAIDAFEAARSSAPITGSSTR